MSSHSSVGNAITSICIGALFIYKIYYYTYLGISWLPLEHSKARKANGVKNSSHAVTLQIRKCENDLNESIDLYGRLVRRELKLEIVQYNLPIIRDSTAYRP